MKHVPPDDLSKLRAADEARKKALIRLGEFRLAAAQAEQPYLMDVARLTAQQSELGERILASLGLSSREKHYRIDTETGLVVEDRGGLLVPVEGDYG